MFVSAIFAIAFSLAPSAAMQDAPAAQDGTVVITGEANKKNKRVCKRSVATGSLMQKVTCRTVSEWEAEKVRNETALERMRTDQRWDQAAKSEKALAGN